MSTNPSGGGDTYNFTRTSAGHLTTFGYQDGSEIEETYDLTTESGTSALVASLPRGYFVAN
jgi:hypothetical protein